MDDIHHTISANSIDNHNTQTQPNKSRNEEAQFSKFTDYISKQKLKSKRKYYAHIIENIPVNRNKFRYSQNSGVKNIDNIEAKYNQILN